MSVNETIINNLNLTGNLTSKNVTVTNSLSSNLLFAENLNVKNITVSGFDVFAETSSLYTIVQTYSAGWDLTSPQNIASTFLAVSGGSIKGNLTVLSSLSVNSNFSVLSGNVTNFIVNNNGLIGINTNNPNRRLTVVGDISSTGQLFAEKNLALKSGDILTEIIFQTDALAAGGASTTTSPLGDRSYALVDAGNVNKWKKSGCTPPVFEFFVIGRVTNSNSFAEFDLISNNLRIPNSYLSTNSTSNVILSSVITQTNLPSSLSLVSIRSGLNGIVGSCSISNATLRATWTVL